MENGKEISQNKSRSLDSKWGFSKRIRILNIICCSINWTYPVSMDKKLLVTNVNFEMW